MPTEYTQTRTSLPERARGLNTHVELEIGGSKAVAKRIIWKSRDLRFSLLAQQLTPGVTLGKPLSLPLGLFGCLLKKT